MAELDHFDLPGSIDNQKMCRGLFSTSVGLQVHVGNPRTDMSCVQGYLWLTCLRLSPQAIRRQNGILPQGIKAFARLLRGL